MDGYSDHHETHHESPLLATLLRPEQLGFTPFPKAWDSSCIPSQASPPHSLVGPFENRSKFEQPIASSVGCHLFVLLSVEKGQSLLRHPSGQLDMSRTLLQHPTAVSGKHET